MKLKCKFDDKIILCKVLENMGFQGGDHVKAVEYNGKERIVIKRGGIYIPKPLVEKIQPPSKYEPQ